MEFYKVKPAQNFKCKVNVPGSKSITNRALIIGALANGRTELKNVLFSDDTIHMMNALRTLGVSIGETPNEKTVSIQRQGTGGLSGTCFVGNSGTTIRFLASLCAVVGGNVELTGVKRMEERPIGDLTDVLTALGSSVIFSKREGYPPLIIKSDGLNGGKVAIKGDISSQFISSILLSAPYARQDIDLEIVGELVSNPYVDMTINMMKDFGIDVENEAYRYFHIKSGQKYKAREYIIESDCSAASYFFAAAAVAGGDVTVENISADGYQGDIKLIDILERMGATVERGTNYIRIIGGKLKGISVDMQDISDVAQTLAVAALFADGPTEIKKVYNMRLKETDRLKALSTELVKLGAKVDERDDGIIIYPISSYRPAEIETYDDHRMAMSFTVAGLRIPGIKILKPGCVSKTFPNFFEEFEKIYIQ